MGENVEALEWSYVSSREKFFKVKLEYILDKLDEYPKFSDTDNYIYCLKI